MGVNLFFFDTYSIALSELADIPFELNSLNLLHIFLASPGFFFTLSNKFDWLKTGFKELGNRNSRNKKHKAEFHYEVLKIINLDKQTLGNLISSTYS